MQAPPIPVGEQERLSQLRSLAILDTPPEERFDRVTRMAQRLFGVPIALVSLVDENRQWFKSCFGLDVSETERRISFCGHAILDNGLFVIEDALQDERFADNPLVTGEPHIRFYAGQPLHTLSGQAMGSLCIMDRPPAALGKTTVPCSRISRGWWNARSWPFNSPFQTNSRASRIAGAS